MRLVKILLIITLVVVSVLYGFTMFTQSMDSSNDAPTLQCDTDVLELSVADDESVLLTGVTAKDRQDGDLTDEIQISGVSKFLETGTSTVTYLVFDSDHNASSLTRTIRFTDYESPRFEVLSPLIYKYRETMELLDRIRIIDGIDGDITDSVRVSTLNPENDENTYSVTFQVSNSMGDSTQLTLPVIWYYDNADRPQIVLTDYLIYLSQGSSFRASDYISYIDTPDGIISKSAADIEGTVDTATPGTYTVCYRYAYEVNEYISQDGIAILTVVVE